MESQKKKNLIRKRRHARVRTKVQGTENCPRLSVFRSAKHIYAQLIDDVIGVTLVSANDTELKKKKMKGKVNMAAEVGKLVGEKALKKEIKTAVFDRGSNKYHGRVKAVADGAREAGLEF